MLPFLIENKWAIFYGIATLFGVALAIRSKRECVQKLMAILLSTWFVSNYITGLGLTEVRGLVYPMMDLFAGLYVSFCIYKYKCRYAKVILFLFLVMGITHLVYNYTNISLAPDNYTYTMILNGLYFAQLVAIYVGSISSKAFNYGGIFHFLYRSRDSGLFSK